MNKKNLFRVYQIISIAFIVTLIMTGSAFARKKDNGKVLKAHEIVNINSAGVEDLILLPGIGKKKADAIIAYRTENKKFNSVNDIKNVKGIGEKLFKKIEPHLALPGKTNLKK